MMDYKFKLLLGSKSPRRQEILKMAGFQFETVEINVDEDYPSNIELNKIAEYLALKKSNAYKGLKPNDVLLTSDTVVVNNKKVFEKPKDRDAALAMLQELNAKEHFVYSSVCLRNIDKIVSFTDKTVVGFKNFSLDELEYYVDTYHPFDKAGGYGVQEWLGMIGVNYIRGSFYNVMGLPIHKVYFELNQF